MNRRKINRLTALLLLAGGALALILYLTAPPEPEDASLADPLAARKLNRELRILGGEANVAAAQFNDWFASLWHGRNLAGTVAVLTVGLTLVFRFIAVRSGPVAPANPPEQKPPPPGPAGS